MNIVIVEIDKLSDEKQVIISGKYLQQFVLVSFKLMHSLIQLCWIEIEDKKFLRKSRPINVRMFLGQFLMKIHKVRVSPLNDVTE